MLRFLVFEWGVWGRDHIHFGFGNALAYGRSLSRDTRQAVPLGLAWMGVVWRRFVSLCGGDWWWARCVRYVVLKGLACVRAAWW